MKKLLHISLSFLVAFQNVHAAVAPLDRLRKQATFPIFSSHQQLETQSTLPTLVVDLSDLNFATTRDQRVHPMVQVHRGVDGLLKVDSHYEGSLILKGISALTADHSLKKGVDVQQVPQDHSPEVVLETTNDLEVTPQVLQKEVEIIASQDLSQEQKIPELTSQDLEVASQIFEKEPAMIASNESLHQQKEPQCGEKGHVSFEEKSKFQTLKASLRRALGQKKKESQDTYSLKSAMPLGHQSSRTSLGSYVMQMGSRRMSLGSLSDALYKGDEFDAAGIPSQKKVSKNSGFKNFFKIFGVSSSQSSGPLQDSQSLKLQSLNPKLLVQQGASVQEKIQPDRALPETTPLEKQKTDDYQGDKQDVGLKILPPRDENLNTSATQEPSLVEAQTPVSDILLSTKGPIIFEETLEASTVHIKSPYIIVKPGVSLLATHDLMLSTLDLSNHGLLQSQLHMLLNVENGGTLLQKGVLNAAGDLIFTGEGHLAQYGKVVAGGDIIFGNKTLKGDLPNDPDFFLENTGIMLAAGNIVGSLGCLHNVDGDIGAGGSMVLHIKGPFPSVNSGTLYAENALGLLLKGGDASHEALISTGYIDADTLSVASQGALINQGRMHGKSRLSCISPVLTNGFDPTMDTVSVGDAELRAPQMYLATELLNGGNLRGDQLNLWGNMLNFFGSTTQFSKNITFSYENSHVLNYGTLSAPDISMEALQGKNQFIQGEQGKLEAENLIFKLNILRINGKVQAQKSMNLQVASRGHIGKKGVVLSEGNLNLDALGQSFKNEGHIQGQTTRLNIQGLYNHEGQLRGHQRLTLEVDSLEGGLNSLIFSEKNVDVTVYSELAMKGRVASGGNLTFSAKKPEKLSEEEKFPVLWVFHDHARITAKKAISLESGDLNVGSNAGFYAYDIDLKDLLEADIRGDIQAQNDLKIHDGILVSVALSGLLWAGKALSINRMDKVRLAGTLHATTFSSQDTRSLTFQGDAFVQGAFDVQGTDFYLGDSHSQSHRPAYLKAGSVNIKAETSHIYKDGTLEAVEGSTFSISKVLSHTGNILTHALEIVAPIVDISGITRLGTADHRVAGESVVNLRGEIHSYGPVVFESLHELVMDPEASFLGAQSVEFYSKGPINLQGHIYTPQKCVTVTGDNTLTLKGCLHAAGLHIYQNSGKDINLIYPEKSLQLSGCSTIPGDSHRFKDFTLSLYALQSNVKMVVDSIIKGNVGVSSRALKLEGVLNLDGKDTVASVAALQAYKDILVEGILISDGSVQFNSESTTLSRRSQLKAEELSVDSNNKKFVFVSDGALQAKKLYLDKAGKSFRVGSAWIGGTFTLEKIESDVTFLEFEGQGTVDIIETAGLCDVRGKLTTQVLASSDLIVHPEAILYGSENLELLSDTDGFQDDLLSEIFRSFFGTNKFERLYGSKKNTLSILGDLNVQGILLARAKKGIFLQGNVRAKSLFCEVSEGPVALGKPNKKIHISSDKPSLIQASGNIIFDGEHVYTGSINAQGDDIGLLGSMDVDSAESSIFFAMNKIICLEGHLVADGRVSFAAKDVNFLEQSQLSTPDLQVVLLGGMLKSLGQVSCKNMGISRANEQKKNLIDTYLGGTFSIGTITYSDKDFDILQKYEEDESQESTSSNVKHEPVEGIILVGSGQINKIEKGVTDFLFIQGPLNTTGSAASLYAKNIILKPGAKIEADATLALSYQNLSIEKATLVAQKGLEFYGISEGSQAKFTGVHITTPRFYAPRDTKNVFVFSGNTLHSHDVTITSQTLVFDSGLFEGEADLANTIHTELVSQNIALTGEKLIFSGVDIHSHNCTLAFSDTLVSHPTSGIFAKNSLILTYTGTIDKFIATTPPGTQQVTFPACCQIGGRMISQNTLSIRAANLFVAPDALSSRINLQGKTVSLEGLMPGEAYGTETLYSTSYYTRNKESFEFNGITYTYRSSFERAAAAYNEEVKRHNETVYKTAKGMVKDPNDYRRYEGNVGLKTTGGAGWGALVGGIILGPAGAVIGGIAGGATSSNVSQDNQNAENSKRARDAQKRHEDSVAEGNRYIRSHTRDYKTDYTHKTWQEQEPVISTRSIKNFKGDRVGNMARSFQLNGKIQAEKLSVNAPVIIQEATGVIEVKEQGVFEGVTGVFSGKLVPYQSFDRSTSSQDIETVKRLSWLFNLANIQGSPLIVGHCVEFQGGGIFDQHPIPANTLLHAPLTFDRVQVEHPAEPAPSPTLSWPERGIFADEVTIRGYVKATVTTVQASHLTLSDIHTATLSGTIEAQQLDVQAHHATLSGRVTTDTATIHAEEDVNLEGRIAARAVKITSGNVILQGKASRIDATESIQLAAEHATLDGRLNAHSIGAVIEQNLTMGQTARIQADTVQLQAHYVEEANPKAIKARHLVLNLSGPTAKAALIQGAKHTGAQHVEVQVDKDLELNDETLSVNHRSLHGRFAGVFMEESHMDNMKGDLLVESTGAFDMHNSTLYAAGDLVAKAKGDINISRDIRTQHHTVEPQRGWLGFSTSQRTFETVELEKEAALAGENISLVSKEGKISTQGLATSDDQTAGIEAQNILHMEAKKDISLKAATTLLHSSAQESRWWGLSETANKTEQTGAAVTQLKGKHINLISHEGVVRGQGAQLKAESGYIKGEKGTKLLNLKTQYRSTTTHSGFFASILGMSDKDWNSSTLGNSLSLTLGFESVSESVASRGRFKGAVIIDDLHLANTADSILEGDIQVKRFTNSAKNLVFKDEGQQTHTESHRQYVEVGYQRSGLTGSVCGASSTTDHHTYTDPSRVNIGTFINRSAGAHVRFEGGETGGLGAQQGEDFSLTVDHAQETFSQSGTQTRVSFNPLASESHNPLSFLSGVGMGVKGGHSAKSTTVDGQEITNIVTPSKTNRTDIRPKDFDTTFDVNASVRLDFTSQTPVQGLGFQGHSAGNQFDLDTAMLGAPGGETVLGKVAATAAWGAQWATAALDTANALGVTRSQETHGIRTVLDHVKNKSTTLSQAADTHWGKTLNNEVMLDEINRQCQQALAEGLLPEGAHLAAALAESNVVLGLEGLTGEKLKQFIQNTHAYATAVEAQDLTSSYLEAWAERSGQTKMCLVSVSETDEPGHISVIKKESSGEWRVYEHDGTPGSLPVAGKHTLIASSRSRVQGGVSSFTSPLVQDLSAISDAAIFGTPIQPQVYENILEMRELERVEKAKKLQMLLSKASLYASDGNQNKAQEYSQKADRQALDLQAYTAQTQALRERRSEVWQDYETYENRQAAIASYNIFSDPSGPVDQNLFRDDDLNDRDAFMTFIPGMEESQAKHGGGLAGFAGRGLESTLFFNGSCDLETAQWYGEHAARLTQKAVTLSTVATLFTGVGSVIRGGMAAYKAAAGLGAGIYAGKVIGGLGAITAAHVTADYCLSPEAMNRVRVAEEVALLAGTPASLRMLGSAARAGDARFGNWINRAMGREPSQLVALNLEGGYKAIHLQRILRQPENLTGAQRNLIDRLYVELPNVMKGLPEWQVSHFKGVLGELRVRAFVEQKLGGKFSCVSSARGQGIDAMAEFNSGGYKTIQVIEIKYKAKGGAPDLNRVVEKSHINQRTQKKTSTQLESQQGSVGYVQPFLDEKGLRVADFMASKELRTSLESILKNPALGHVELVSYVVNAAGEVKLYRGRRVTLEDFALLKEAMATGETSLVQPLTKASMKEIPIE